MLLSLLLINGFILLTFCLFYHDKYFIGDRVIFIYPFYKATDSYLTFFQQILIVNFINQIFLLLKFICFHFYL